MHVHNWFGIPRWVLDSQTQVRQALEVYSGKPVYFSAFKAKTLRREKDVARSVIMEMEFEHDIVRRSIKFTGTIEGLSGLSHTIEGEFRLRQEQFKEGVWWVDIASWEFVLRDHKDAPGNFVVEILDPDRFPGTDPRPRIKVGKKPEHCHRNRIVEGSNLLDRVVLQDQTFLLDTYTNW